MAKESWYWLANGLGWGAVNSGDILAAYPGGADDIAHALGGEKLDELLTQKQADRLAQSRPEDFALRVHQAQSQGIEIICFSDSDYPEALRTIHNPPLVLFVKGDKGLLNGQLSLGVVGARRPSAYGVEAVKAIGRGVALGGAIIVSGLAAGLDAEAHKAALAVNGPTIACIAFGHDNCYPAANRKLMEVIERYGAVISEYPPGTTPEKHYFLQRNRIIAGLSHGLVVIEARRHSGTMSTVNFAVDFGREVFAVPGSIFSELSGGTNAMIQEGAYVAASATDVLSVYGIELAGEDPVATAAKQAVEGRPAPASMASPWQQSIKRFERSRQEEQEPLPGQQSLGEMLRGQLGEGKGEVSAAQAAKAFRALQSSLPATANSALDARNRALDEMVEAVSDNVQISAAGRGAQKPSRKEPPKPQGPQPFPWHQVERLDKSEVEDLSPAKGKAPARRPKLAERLFGPAEPAKSPQKQVPLPAPARLEAGEDDLAAASKTPPATSFLRRFAGSSSPQGTAGDYTPVERISGLGSVPSVGPVTGVGPVQAPSAFAPLAGAPPAGPGTETQAATQKSEPERQAAPVSKAPPQPPPPAQKKDFVAKPVAERPAPRPRADASLSGRLKTLQPSPENPPPLPEKPRRQLQPQPQAKHQPTAKPPGSGRTDTLTTTHRPPAAGAGQPDTSVLSGAAALALAQLSIKPLSLTDICQRSGLSSGGAMAALTELELAGLSRQLPGRQFVLAQ